MPVRRLGRIENRAARTMRLGLLLSLCGAAQLPGCLFPDYQTASSASGGAAANGATAGSGGSSGDAAQGGVASSTSAGSSAAGSGGGGVAGTSAQAGTPAEAGNAAGGEPQGGAGGAGSDSGIVLFDDFEDQNDDGWFPTSGDWQVGSDGTSQVYRIVNLLDASLFSVIGDLEWTDVVVEAKVKVLEWGGVSSSDLVGVYARFDSPSTHYYVALRADGKLALRKKVDTNVTLGTPVDLGLQSGVQYRVKFELVGSELKAYLDDVLQISVTDSELTSGRIAAGADFGRAEFDDIRVTLPEP